MTGGQHGGIACGKFGSTARCIGLMRDERPTGRLIPSRPHTDPSIRLVPVDHPGLAELTIHKKPTYGWDQAKRYTTQIENRCKHWTSC